MINETRVSTERRMLGDIQELLTQGEEVNQQDSQGATLVRLCLFRPVSYSNLKQTVIFFFGHKKKLTKYLQKHEGVLI